MGCMDYHTHGHLPLLCSLTSWQKFARFQYVKNEASSKRLFIMSEFSFPTLLPPYRWMMLSQSPHHDDLGVGFNENSVPKLQMIFYSCKFFGKKMFIKSSVYEHMTFPFIVSFDFWVVSTKLSTIADGNFSYIWLMTTVKWILSLVFFACFNKTLYLCKVVLSCLHSEQN